MTRSFQHVGENFLSTRMLRRGNTSGVFAAGSGPTFSKLLRGATTGRCVDLVTDHTGPRRLRRTLRRMRVSNSVAVDGVEGMSSCECGTQIGSVAREGAGPLRSGHPRRSRRRGARRCAAAAGHADVGRGRARVLADQDVRGVGGLALGAVGGACVGELDVESRRRGTAGCACEPLRTSRPSVAVDTGDGPGVAVGDLEIGVVASGGDPVADGIAPPRRCVAVIPAPTRADLLRRSMRRARMAVFRPATWSRGCRR